MMTVTLKDYASEFFPVEASWNHGRESDVFETVDAAKAAMAGRFGSCRFIDHTGRRSDRYLVRIYSGWYTYCPMITEEIVTGKEAAKNRAIELVTGTEYGYSVNLIA